MLYTLQDLAAAVDAAETAALLSGCCVGLMAVLCNATAWLKTQVFVMHHAVSAW
jgi:hypothetical protein